MTIRRLRVSIVALLAISLFYYGLVRFRKHTIIDPFSVNPVNEKLTVQPVSPLITASPPVVELGSLQEFVFVVKNISLESIDNLRIGIGCQCNVTQPLPRALQAGESARIAFTIRASKVGVSSEQVSIEAGNETIWRFLAQAEAKTKVPLIVSDVEHLRLIFTKGMQMHNSIKIRTLESSAAPAWIVSANSSNASFAFEDSTFTEIPVESSDSIVERTYALRFKGKPDSVGTSRCMIELVCRLDHVISHENIAIDIESQEPLQSLPPAFNLSGDSTGFASVLIVNRTGISIQQPVVPEGFDAKIFGDTKARAIEMTITRVKTNESGSARPIVTVKTSDGCAHLDIPIVQNESAPN